MKTFTERYEAALADPNIRSGLLAFQRAWKNTRRERLDQLEAKVGQPFEELRHELASTKQAVRDDLDHELDRFIANAEAAGSTVVQVATAAEANAYIADLCRQRGVELVVKGKSMVSEETMLNAHLESLGIAAVETDLGEWILQLSGEHPSHLVMPAIHKRKEQVATLFERVLGREFPPDDIDRMVKAARTELRERFLSAGMGLSGANALIGESGAILLVTNEGNNRMSVSLPPLHVVVAGFDKLIPSYRDAMAQVRLLARSATGQPISVYTTFVAGPRPGGEQHIVLVDNGRSAMHADERFDQALGCIRCGACADACPPYQIVGGHAFGHVYTGAIGLVNTPFHHGWEAAAGPQSLCVSCNACATVCPAEIPLPAQILEVRKEVVERIGIPPAKRAAFAAFASRELVAAGAWLAGLVSRPLARDGHLQIPGLTNGSSPAANGNGSAVVPAADGSGNGVANGRGAGVLEALRRQVSWRSLPAVPPKPARSRLRSTPDVAPLGQTELTGARVVLFLQCVSDRLVPDIAVATARLLRAAGAEVIMPRDQHCCGLPAFDSGVWGPAKAMGEASLDTLERATRGADLVVTPAPSCVVMIAHEYQRLFRDQPDLLARAEHLAPRVLDLVDVLDGPGRLPAGALADGPSDPVTVHRFCQSSNVLDRGAVMERVVTHLTGRDVVPLPEAEVCCGFGGSTSVSAPEVAAGIVDRKLGCVDDTGSRILLTDNPGCIVHLRGAVDASRRGIDVRHIGEYLADRLPS